MIKIKNIHSQVKQKIKNKLLYKLTNIIIFVLLSTGCSKKIEVFEPFNIETSKTREILIGSWYGSQPTKDGGIYEWTTTNFYDGKYKIEGTVTNIDGEKSSHLEVGEWGVSGNIKFDIFKGWLSEYGCRKSSPSNSINYNVYKIISIKDDSITYKSIPNGQKFFVKKLDNKDRPFEIEDISNDCFK